MTSHTVPPDAPADTQMMGIVHSALRRDLVRVAPGARHPAGRRAGPSYGHRRARALDDATSCTTHHSGEDDGLYPLVVRRNPQSADLVEQMDADHGTITPAMDGLVSAAQRHLADPTVPTMPWSAAIDALTDVLIPHLEREEPEMMPVVSQSITEGEWRTWDEEFNLKPKGIRALADEGHWVIDGLDPTSRRPRRAPRAARPPVRPDQTARRSLPTQARDALGRHPCCRRAVALDRGGARVGGLTWRLPLAPVRRDGVATPRRPRSGRS